LVTLYQGTWATTAHLHIRGDIRANSTIVEHALGTSTSAATSA